MQKLLEEEYSSKTESSYFLSSDANKHSTTDGIEKGALRLWKEIMLIAKDPLYKNHLQKISFIGHSLGGLYARYVLKLLQDCGIFSQLRPVYFITFATPHLGARRRQKSFVDKTFHSVAGVLNLTSIQLCLKDDLVPIVFSMVQESYLKPLRMFEKRVA